MKPISKPLNPPRTNKSNYETIFDGSNSLTIISDSSMLPKRFIKETLIDGIGIVIQNKQYWLAFALMAIGIEFLGKCLDEKTNDWNRGKSERDFSRAVTKLKSFDDYKDKLGKPYKLWDSFRNGFAHSFIMKNNTISLSSRNEAKHFDILDGKLNLHCETLYSHFATACNEIIAMEFNDPKDKMNHNFISFI